MFTTRSVRLKELLVQKLTEAVGEQVFMMLALILVGGLVAGGSQVPTSLQDRRVDKTVTYCLI